MLFTHTGLSPTMVIVSKIFWLLHLNYWPVPLSLVTTRGISVDFFSSGYLDISVRRVCFTHLFIQCMIQHKAVGCPIQRSTGQRLFAPRRSLSQRITSFIACIRQGIHQTPLIYLQKLFTMSYIELNLHCFFINSYKFMIILYVKIYSQFQTTNQT